MENMEIHVGEEEEEEEAMDLPPGFRFHPTDEELITNYLYPKVLDNHFIARAIGEVDLNKCEPWELPSLAKMGEKEWYFFCVRDRKYPTGLRTNRATEAGYWKATGKDKEIFRDKTLVGMKKTLVFYKGRAPKGEKSNWVIHEYRLDGNSSLQNIPSNSKNEWTICRVFEKSGEEKKLDFSGLTRPEPYKIECNPTGSLPPLMESSPYNVTNSGVLNVPCFSIPMDTSTGSSQNRLFYGTNQPYYDGFISNPIHSISNHPNDNNYFPRVNGDNSYLRPQKGDFTGNYLMSEHYVLRTMPENHGTEMKQSVETEEVNYSASQETGLSSDINVETSSIVSNYNISRRPSDDVVGPSTSGGPVDLENLWNY
ncbi:hypothetical protein RND81_13G116000 [Saponaria officinalis]|uniref:NAC domain-containing protein n=1 Tax=Saponaria officinalis TaxID=3572 RepID=A0AAW1GZT8_SAPOF